MAIKQFIVKRKMSGDEFAESYKFKSETVRQYVNTVSDNYYFISPNCLNPQIIFKDIYENFLKFKPANTPVGLKVTY